MTNKLYFLIWSIFLVGCSQINILPQREIMQPVETPTWSPTLIPTSTPTYTPTNIPPATPTNTPSFTPTNTQTPTLLPTPSEIISEKNIQRLSVLSSSGDGAVLGANWSPRDRWIAVQLPSGLQLFNSHDFSFLGFS